MLNKLFLAVCVNVLAINLVVIGCEKKAAENRSSHQIIPSALTGITIVSPPSPFINPDTVVISNRFLVPYDVQTIETIKSAFDKFCLTNQKPLASSTKLQDSCKRVQQLSIEALLQDSECIAAVNTIHTSAMNTEEYRSAFWHVIRCRKFKKRTDYIAILTAWADYRLVLKSLHRKYIREYLPEIHLPAADSKDPATDFIELNEELNDPKALAAFLFLEALPIQIQKNYGIPFK